MKKLTIIVLALLCLCLFSPALAEEDGNPPTAPELTFQGNPTTGYEWLYAVEDESVLFVTDNGFVQDEAGQEMVGVGGQFCFRLDGVKPGSTTVTFRYARSWENDEAAPTISYTVLVDEELNVIIYGGDVNLGN